MVKKEISIIPLFWATYWSQLFTNIAATETSLHIGKEYTVRETQAILEMVSKGCYAVESAAKINNGRAKIPITESILEILYKKVPDAIFSELIQELR